MEADQVNVMIGLSSNWYCTSDHDTVITDAVPWHSSNWYCTSDHDTAEVSDSNSAFWSVLFFFSRSCLFNKWLQGMCRLQVKEMVCVCLLKRDGGGGGGESPGDMIFERLQMWDVSAAYSCFLLLWILVSHILLKSSVTLHQMAFIYLLMTEWSPWGDPIQLIGC